MEKLHGIRACVFDAYGTLFDVAAPVSKLASEIGPKAPEIAALWRQKQLEYSGYIEKSSAALLAIINDILDLASIDTDAMELELTDVDIRQAIETAAQGLQDRLAESSIRLQIVAMDNVGTFRADAKRLRQVLFNLLSNAIGFSTPGQTVTLAAMRLGARLVGRGPHFV